MYIQTLWHTGKHQSTPHTYYIVYIRTYAHAYYVVQQVVAHISLSDCLSRLFYLPIPSEFPRQILSQHAILSPHTHFCWRCHWSWQQRQPLVAEALLPCSHERVLVLRRMVSRDDKHRASGRSIHRPLYGPSTPRTAVDVASDG